MEETLATFAIYFWEAFCADIVNHHMHISTICLVIILY